MRALRYRFLGCHSVAVSLLLACSVFPEEAVLSGTNDGGFGQGGAPGGAGGTEVSAGETSVPPVGGVSATGGSAPSVGGSGGASSGGGDSGSGGSTAQAGAGGDESPACAEPQELTVTTTLDLWIGAADPSATHGTEPRLEVSGGDDERRALFEITVPAAPLGTQLLEASLVLSLESNADVSGAERRLGARLLTPLREVVEAEANWNRFGKNNGAGNRWGTNGGDLGELLAETVVPSGTTSALVRFDVTESVRGVLAAQPSVYGIAILELSSAPAAPAALAFTSREGNASTSPAPALRLRYCLP